MCSEKLNPATKCQVLSAKCPRLGEDVQHEMVEELEQEYAALRDKVRDLQEYL